MTRDETIDLLTFMAAYDRRTVGEADVKAWAPVMEDLSFADAMDAVARHYGRDSTDWMMPKHVRDGVKAFRAERIARSVIPAPPRDLADDPAAYRQALAESVKRAGDGRGQPADSHLAIAGGATPQERRGHRPPASLRSAFAELRAALGPARQRRASSDPQGLAAEQAATARAEREAREARDQSEAS